MPKIRMPDGTVVAFPDEMPRDQITGLIASKFPDAPGIVAPAKAFQQQAGQIMNDLAASGSGTKYEGRNPLIPDRLEALTEGSQAGLMGGYDDEIGAGMTAPINAGISWLKGNGFDIGKEYEKTRASNDFRKQQRRESYPAQSIAGEVAGGLALGGAARAAPAAGAVVPAMSRMPTLIGRDLPLIGKVGATAAEGAGYGALYGSGEAKPGERLQGAETGALTGAALGTALHGAGNLLSKAIAPKAQVAAAPLAEDMGAEAQTLYKSMEDSGVTIKPDAVKRLKANIGVSLGRTNSTLAPKAVGLQKLANQTLGPNAGIGDLHNFAKAVNQELRSKLEGADAHYVPLLKSQVEALIEQGSNIANIPGGKATEAFQMWKQADALWAKMKKTEVLNNILDTADMKTGQYTQSGLANTIRREMDKLYTSIKKGRSKGWTQEEVALIRQMAKGGSNSQMVNLLAKFAPRGVVSAIGGFALGGPGLTLAGHLAGQAADRGAVNAATLLRDAAARGYTIPTPLLENKLSPFIRGVAAPNREDGRLLDN